MLSHQLNHLENRMVDFTKIKNFVTIPKGLSYLGMGNIVSSAISGIFWLLIARIVDVDSYGELTYLISIAMITTTVCLVGGSTTINVFTSKNLQLQKTIYFLNSISSVIGGIIVFLLFDSLGISLYVVGYVIFSLFLNEMLGKRIFKEYSYILILQKVLMVSFAIPLYFIMNIEGIILGIAMSFFPFLYKIFFSIKEQKFGFSKLKTRMGFILNNQGLELGVILNTQIDKILIVPILGFTVLGNYSLSFQIISLAGIITGIVYQYTLPHDARGITKPLLKKFTILSSILVTFLVIVLSPILMPIFFPNYVDAIEIIQIMSLILVPGAFTLMYTSKFLGNGKSKFVIIASGIQFSILVSVIVILGDTLGVNGVVIAVVSARIFQAIFLTTANKLVFKKF
jgi:O-antigen/teichoic acid export membrane protein